MKAMDMYKKPKKLAGFGGDKRTPSLNYNKNVFGKPKTSGKNSGAGMILKKMLGK